MTRHYTRRAALQSIGAAAVGLTLSPASSLSQTIAESSRTRPAVADRRFGSTAVEQFLIDTSRRIEDPLLAQLFTNCFPNTLDTTVEPGNFEGKPDTAVITGDIAAMWLRDSSAQVWSYLPLARKDPALLQLLEGVIRRQALPAHRSLRQCLHG